MISPLRKPAGFSHNDARSRPTIPHEVAFAHMAFSKALVRLRRSPWISWLTPHVLIRELLLR